MSFTYESFTVSGYSTGITGTQVNEPLNFIVSGLKYASVTLDGSYFGYLTGMAVISSGITKASGAFFWNADEDAWSVFLGITDEGEAGNVGTGFADFTLNSGAVSDSTGYAGSGIVVFGNANTKAWNAITDTNGSVDNADGQHSHAAGGAQYLGDLTGVGTDGAIVYTDKYILMADGDSYESSDDYLVTSGDVVTHHANTSNPHEVVANQVEVEEINGATYNDVQDWINNCQSAGRIDGGVITDSGGGQVDVAAGRGFIKTSNSESGLTKSFDWTAETNIVLTDNSMNYLYIDYNSGTPQVGVTTTRSNISFTDEIGLGRVYRAGTDLKIMSGGIGIYNATYRTHKRLAVVDGFIRASGGLTSMTLLKVAITAGVAYYGLTQMISAALDTSVAGTFTYMYSDGGVGWTSVAAQTDIDNTHYDDGDGTLGDLTVNQYGIHWVYWCMGTEEYFVIYGMDSYKLSEAEEEPVPTNIPDCLVNMGFLLAKIIIKKSGATADRIDTPWEGKFAGAGISEHNDQGGIQGGTADEYYHTTAQEYADIQSLTGEWLESSGAWATASGDYATTSGTIADYPTVSGDFAEVSGSYAILSGAVSDYAVVSGAHANVSGDLVTHLAATNPHDIDINEISGTAWRMFYSDASQGVKELALGTSGLFLSSDGTAAAPVWATAAGAGDNLGDHEATQILDMNSNKITGLTDPTADQDASTKKYVDDIMASLLAIGSANRQWIGCVFESSSEWFRAGTTYKNQGATDIAQRFAIPLPIELGDYSLHIDAWEIGLLDADASNKITWTSLYSVTDYNTQTIEETDTAAYSTIAAHLHEFAAAVDFSAKQLAFLRFVTAVALGSALEINYVKVRYYYI